MRARATIGYFRRQKTIKCFVYLIRSSEGLCKIGRTIDPQDRLKTLQLNTGVALTLEYSKDLRSKGKRVEKELHRLYAEKKIRGEWFALEATDVEAVKAYIKAVKR